MQDYTFLKACAWKVAKPTLVLLILSGLLEAWDSQLLTKFPLINELKNTILSLFNTKEPLDSSRRQNTNTSQELYDSLFSISSNYIRKSFAYFSKSECNLCRQPLATIGGNVYRCIDCHDQHVCMFCEAGRDHPSFHRVIKLGLKDLTNTSIAKLNKLHSSDYQPDNVMAEQEYITRNTENAFLSSEQDDDCSVDARKAQNTFLYYNTADEELCVPLWPLKENMEFRQRFKTSKYRGISATSWTNPVSSIPVNPSIKLLQFIDKRLFKVVTFGTHISRSECDTLFEVFSSMADIGVFGELSLGLDIKSFNETFSLGHPLTKVHAKPQYVSFFPGHTQISVAYKHSLEKVKLELPSITFRPFPGEPFTLSKVPDPKAPSLGGLNASKPEILEAISRHREKRIDPRTIYDLDLESLYKLPESMDSLKFLETVKTEPGELVVNIWPAVSNNHFMQLFVPFSAMTRTRFNDSTHEKTETCKPNSLAYSSDNAELCQLFASFYDYNNDGFIDFAEFVCANSVLYHSPKPVKVGWVLRGLIQYYCLEGALQGKSRLCSHVWMYAKVLLTAESKDTTSSRYLDVDIEEMKAAMRRLFYMYQEFAKCMFAQTLSIVEENKKASLRLSGQVAVDHDRTTMELPRELSNYPTSRVGSLFSEYNPFPENPSVDSQATLMASMDLELMLEDYFGSKVPGEALSVVELAQGILDSCPQLGHLLAACAEASVV